MALFLQLLMIVAGNWKVAKNLILLIICLYVCVKYYRARQQWPLYLDYLLFSMVENIVFSFSFFRCWEALVTECLEPPFEIGQG